MKKIIPVLIAVMFLALAENALAVGADIKFKSGDKNVVLKEVDAEPNQLCRQVYVDNKLVIDPGMTNGYIFCGMEGYNRVYKTDQKDIIVINTNPGDMSLLSTWTFVNIKDSTSFDLLERGSFTINNGAESLILKGFEIVDDIKSNKCDSDNVKSVLQAVKTKVVFGGFKSDDKNIYKPNNSSSFLDCVYTRFREGGDEDQAFVIGTGKEIQGVSRNLSLVYFSASARGKGWTAYYAYDAKANKITKTTLAKINKDKMKLTLVKKF